MGVRGLHSVRPHAGLALRFARLSQLGDDDVLALIGFGHLSRGATVALHVAMTRSFHHAVRLIPRRAPRPPRAHTLSFTSFRLVAVDDDAGSGFAAIELADPRNAMRSLAVKRRRF